MDTQTQQRLRNNSYHLVIRSSLQAIQSTLLLQKIMLQSQHATFTDIKATIAAQNTALQNTTKTLTDYFSKISTFQPPPAPSTPLTTAAMGVRTQAPSSHKSSTPPKYPPNAPSHGMPPYQQPNHARPMFAAQGSQQQPQGPHSASPATPKLGENRVPDTKVKGDVKNENKVSEKGGNSENEGKNVSKGDRPAKAEDKKDTFAPDSMIPNKGQVASNMHPPPQQNSYQSPLEIYINNLEKGKNDSWYAANFDGIKMQFFCQIPFAMMEQFDHKLFVKLLERRAKKKFEMEMFVFDPGGGTFNFGSIFDLEDKVGFKGQVMIRQLCSNCSIRA